MSFADRYLIKNAVESLIDEEPHPETRIMVVIPCLREPEIVDTLEALKRCSPPKCKVEVLVVINHSEQAPEEVKKFNHSTREKLEIWLLQNPVDWGKIFVLGPVELRRKWAGAGLARKSGMDEAVRRFNWLEAPQGIIVSLDADTLVESNYLQAIERYFLQHPSHIGCTLAFAHQKEGLSGRLKEGIELYETYLHYYKNALAFTGYPYAMFTIGSAFAVKAEAYVKRGGMNRRQAGEDFYFLQNLVQMGTVGELTDTCVFPAARLSDRVPFGTGPILKKWMDGEEDLSLTYNFSAFEDLRMFFEAIPCFFQTNRQRYFKVLSGLPASICLFLEEDRFWDDLDQLNRNCASEQNFRTRFFQLFNAFRILKFLNFSHEKYYKKAGLHRQVERLTQALKLLA